MISDVALTCILDVTICTRHGMNVLMPCASTPNCSTPKDCERNMVLQRLMGIGPQIYRVQKRSEVLGALHQLHQQSDFGSEEFVKYTQLCKSELHYLTVLLKVICFCASRSRTLPYGVCYQCRHLLTQAVLIHSSI